MLCGYKNNVPAAINRTFHMILSIIKLGHGIQEMRPEMEEHAFLLYAIRKLIYILLSSGLKMSSLTNCIMLLPFLTMINSTALLGNGFMLLFQKRC